MAVNTTIIDGTLVANPKRIGDKVVIRIAHNRELGGGKQHTTFHNAKCYDHTAEIAMKNLFKGKAVTIEGYLDVEEWVDKDTNQRREATYICFHRQTFRGNARKPQKADKKAKPVRQWPSAKR